MVKLEENELMIKDELAVFNSDMFGEVRIIMINDKPYFIANDIAKCLGYKSPKDAISRHCKGAVFDKLKLSHHRS